MAQPVSPMSNTLRYSSAVQSVDTVTAMEQPIYDDAPEVVPNRHYSTLEHIAYDESGNMKVFIQPENDNYPEAYITHQQPGEVDTRKWWQRKRVWITLAVVLAVIGLAVGLVVGLVVKKHSSHSEGPEDDDPNVPRAHICYNRICPQVLSTVILDGEIHLFARRNDDHIQERVWDGEAWDNDWTDLGNVEDQKLNEAGYDGDLGGNFISQPVAIAWDDDDTGVLGLSVFAISLTDNTVWHLRRNKGTSQSEWEEIAYYVSSSLQVCGMGSDSIDIWTTKDETIYHYPWNPSNEELRDVEHNIGNNTFLIAADSTGFAVACRDANISHDLVWYDGDKVSHAFYDSNYEEWSDPYSITGKFRGDPTIFSFDEEQDRVDFFGNQENGEVWHFIRSNGDYSKLESLGGDIISVPSVISTSNGMYDLVALGGDGQLKHLHYNGDAWAEKWEDLGAYGQSAPLLMIQDKHIFLFVLGNDGTGDFAVLSASWKAGGQTKWAELIDMEVLGGLPSKQFYRYDVYPVNA